MISLKWYEAIAIVVCYIACVWTSRVVVSRMLYKSVFGRKKVRMGDARKGRTYNIKDRVIDLTPLNSEGVADSE